MVNTLKSFYVYQLELLSSYLKKKKSHDSMSIKQNTLNFCHLFKDNTNGVGDLDLKLLDFWRTLVSTIPISFKSSNVTYAPPMFMVFSKLPFNKNPLEFHKKWI